MCQLIRHRVDLRGADTQQQSQYVVFQLYFSFKNIYIRVYFCLQRIRKKFKVFFFFCLARLGNLKRWKKRFREMSQSDEPVTDEIQKQSTKHLKVSLKNLMENR